MRSNLIIDLLVPLVVMLMVGCGLKPEYIVNLSMAETPTCKPQTESIHGYSDLLAKTPSATRELVATLAFTPNSDSVWIAYGRESLDHGGPLLRVQLPDWRMVNQVLLDSLSSRFTRFNGDATLIASFKRVQCPFPHLSSPGSGGLCAEPMVWRTTTGELVSVPTYPVTNLEDVAFDKQGTWIVIAEGNLSIFNPAKPTSGSSMGITDDERDDVITVAFNNVGNLIAYGTSGKKVGITGWDGRTLKFAYSINLGITQMEDRGEFKLDSRPIRLAIAPNNKWLTVQYAEGLELREMSSGFFPQQGKVVLPRTLNGNTAKLTWARCPPGAFSNDAPNP